VQQVLEELPPSTKVSASLVWVRVLSEDHEQAAQAAAEGLQSPLLHHFYDPEQRAARQMGAILGGAGHFAWDVYLVFAAGTLWEDEPPLPAGWAHQLDHSTWAPAERRHKGEALINALRSLLVCE